MNRVPHTLIRLSITVFFLCQLCLTTQAQLREFGVGATSTVQAPHVRAELLPGASAYAPGSRGDLALVLHLEQGWHVYWVQAGDSGEPPVVEWTLPKGIHLGPMEFPAPKRLPLGPLMDYGYEGTAVFPFTLATDSSLEPGTATLQAHVRWLVCREVCIPGKAFLGTALRIVPGASAASSDVITAARRSEPQPLPTDLTLQTTATRDHLALTIQGDRRETSAAFYPLDENTIRNAADQRLTPSSNGATLTLERIDASDVLPRRLHGVLELSNRRNYLIDTPVARATIPTPPTTSSFAGLGAPLLLAFAGGLLLNLMPCVFPVLFLKALSLVSSAREQRRAHRLHGAAYTFGILVSFWSIVAVLLIVRAAGHQAGWGFQLQSPTFVVLIASLLFFMALSLAGQFDLGLSLTGSGDALTRKSGYIGSFFTGVLATVVATPCTAPLMGAAIGYALAQPGFATFLIFTALATGLALPYLLLTLNPGWARLLPRPGRWMETLKQLTAVPLLFTVVWLVWVYGRLYSAAPGDAADHIARLLAGLVVLAIGGWALHRWPIRRIGWIVATALTSASLAISLSSAQADSLNWQPFSVGAIQQAQAQGRPVFVDYTAAWCLSCQVTERTVLHDATVERQLGTHHYVLLRADWTRYDPAITQQLAQVSRSGVPTYVIYPAQPAAPPQVLPELLTRTAVLNAIAAPRS